jgi:Arc/MetJ-type ribon-helix-helix transcriptional regulator
MKIVTINVPQSYVNAMKKLTGENGFYPSRSELIRVAVREFLIGELNWAKELSESIVKLDKDEDEDNKDKDNYIQVPIRKRRKGEKETELDFQTFKVVKKLDSGSEDTEGIRESEKDNEKYMTPQRKAEKQIKRYNPDFSGGFF